MRSKGHPKMPQHAVSLFATNPCYLLLLIPLRLLLCKHLAQLV